MSNFPSLVQAESHRRSSPSDGIPSQIPSGDNSNISSADVVQFIHLRKVSVSNLTFVAFLSSEGVVTHAAARVDVALLGH